MSLFFEDLSLRCIFRLDNLAIFINFNEDELIIVTKREANYSLGG